MVEQRARTSEHYICYLAWQNDIHFPHGVCTGAAKVPKMSEIRFLENEAKKLKIYILEEVQADWVELADHLQLPPTTIRNLRSLTPERACRDVFDIWLGGEGVGPRTWETLISVFRNMRKQTLADKISGALQC